MYALYLEGASLREVGERFDLTESRVSQLFKEAGLSTRPALDPDLPTVGELYDAYRRGASLDDIAKRFRIGRRTVRRLFAEAGYDLRSSGETRLVRGSVEHESQLEEMHGLYRSGASLAEVGERFGLAPERVSQLFRRAGLSVRAGGPITPDLPPAEQLHEVYRAGATLTEVAERYGVTRHRVREAFIQAGLPIRSPGESLALRSRRNPHPVKEMYALYQTGLSVERVAPRFGLSPSRVRQLFSEAGLPIRSRGEHPVQEMHQLYESGLSLRGVGERFGLSGAQVGVLFRARKLPVRRGGASKTPISKDQVQEIKDLRRQGATRSEIAERLRLPRSRVIEILREAGLGRPVVTHPIEDMYALYQSGASLREVAEQFGLSRTYVSQLFKQTGKGIRPGGSRKGYAAGSQRAHPIEEMYEMHRSGATLREVGKRYGLSSSRMSDLFRAAGLEVLRHRAEQRVEEMYAFYSEGATLREVGKRYGLSGTEVRRLFLREDLSVRSVSEAHALRRPPLSESQRREICKLYGGGASQRAVAERIGVPVERVRKVVEEEGVLRTSERSVEEMHALYRNGASIHEVARRFDLSAPTVRKRFAEAGLHIRTPGEARALRNALRDLHRVNEMHERYRAGATLTEIGQEFNLDPGRVSQLFRQAGVSVSTVATQARRRARGLSHRPRPERHPVQEMYALYETGASLREVGERYDLGGSYVAALFRRAGLKTRVKNSSRLELPSVEAMHALYRRGASLDEVARRFRVGRQTVRRQFVDAGLHIRTPGEARALRNALRDLHRVNEMHERYRSGATLKDIALEFGVGRDRVVQLFKEAGLPVRPPGRPARSK